MPKGKTLKNNIYILPFKTYKYSLGPALSIQTKTKMIKVKNVTKPKFIFMTSYSLFRQTAVFETQCRGSGSTFKGCASCGSETSD